MPLTPADIHNVAFKKPSLGKRGYDEEEVDAFLDEVEREIQRLADDNSALRAQVETGAGDHDRLSLELQKLHAQLDRLQRERALAEQAAQDAQRQLELARAQAREGAPDDEGRSLPVLMMAQRTADDYLSKARAEADELLSGTRAKIERMVQEAQAEARETELQAVGRHKEAIESLDVKRAEAQRHIITLNHFAHDYRKRLQEHLSSLMNDAGGGGSRDNDRGAAELPTQVRTEI
ncbi:DivIVA domain-containing protein [Salinispora oceanensis]|uniref:DivIVA domain-containing protein n=1 Tax=Salinispora oceanensis TaxID=1050199 RepID=UPI00036DBA63|nr:DivIVA domain-containing protein [Salinispora oceanensis]